jgi:hypothetical protein
MELPQYTLLDDQQTPSVSSESVQNLAKRNSTLRTCPGCGGSCRHCGGKVKQRANRAARPGREKIYCCSKCQKFSSHRRCYEFSKWLVCKMPECSNRVRPDTRTGFCHLHYFYPRRIQWSVCKKQDCLNRVTPKNKTGYCRFHRSIGQYEQLKLKLADIDKLRAERDAIDKKLAAAQIEVEKWSEVGRDAEDETWAMADELYHQKWDWDTIKARCDQIFSVNKTVKAYQEGRRRYLKRKNPTK